MKKALKIIGISFLALMVITFVSNVYNSKKLPKPAPTPEHVTVSPQRTPEPGEVTNYYTKRRIETAQNILEQAFSGTDFYVDWRYDNVNGYVFYDIVSLSIDREFIQNAKDEVGTCRKEWDSLVDAVVHIQSRIQEIFTSADDETVVIVDVLNPGNTDEVWLSVANGIAGYDVVNEIDLLNEG